MIPGIVLVLYLVLLQGAEQADVIVLKHGNPLKGVIIEENDEVVVLRRAEGDREQSCCTSG